jgi:hypothetical protein
MSVTVLIIGTPHHFTFENVAIYDRAGSSEAGEAFPAS